MASHWGWWHSNQKKSNVIFEGSFRDMKVYFKPFNVEDRVSPFSLEQMKADGEAQQPYQRTLLRLSDRRSGAKSLESGIRSKLSVSLLVHGLLSVQTLSVEGQARKMRARQLLSSFALITLTIMRSARATDDRVQEKAARILTSMFEGHSTSNNASPRYSQESSQAGSSAFPETPAPISPRHSGSDASRESPGPSTSSNGLHIHPNEGMPELGTCPWVEVDSIAGTGRGEEEVECQIPKFRHDGRVWGPYPVGSSRFDPQPYHLQRPLFEPLYRPSRYEPLDIESFLQEKNARNWRMLETRGNVFVPEPRLLQDIQQSIWARLEPRGIRGMTGAKGLQEGQWLWPPSEIAADGSGLKMSQYLLSQRLRSALKARFKRHYRSRKKWPTLFRLTVPSNQGERRILMVSAHAPGYVSNPVMLEDSKLSLFYEGVRHEGYRKVAFFGATFLPKAAKKVLLPSQTIRPAFEQLRPK